jgi:hypothetical protein
MMPTSEAAKGRVYFLFGDPIYTDSVKGKENDMEVVEDIVQRTKKAIEDGISILRQRSERDDEEEKTRGGGEESRSRFQALGRWLRWRAAKERGEDVSALVPDDTTSIPSSL